MGPDHRQVVVDMTWEHVWNVVDFDDRNCDHYCADHVYHKVEGEYPHKVLKKGIQMWDVGIETYAAEHKVANTDEDISSPKDQVLVLITWIFSLKDGFNLQCAEEVLETENPVSHTKQHKV